MLNTDNLINSRAQTEMSGTESQDDSKLKDPMEEFLSAVGMAILKPTEKNNKVASEALKRVDCNPLSYAHIRTKITDDHNEHTFFALRATLLQSLDPLSTARSSQTSSGHAYTVSITGLQG